jgi:hypothetical protein
MPAKKKNRLKFSNRFWQLQACALRMIIASFLLFGSTLLPAQTSAAHQSSNGRQATVPRHACSHRRACTCVSPQGTPTATAVITQASGSDNDHESLIKDLVPLLESLLWALLVGVVLVSWRKEITQLLKGHIRVKVGDYEVELFPPEEVTEAMQLPGPNLIPV